MSKLSINSELNLYLMGTKKFCNFDTKHPIDRQHFLCLCIRQSINHQSRLLVAVQSVTSDHPPFDEKLTSCHQLYSCRAMFLTVSVSETIRRKHGHLTSCCFFFFNSSAPSISSNHQRSHIFQLVNNTSGRTDGICKYPVLLILNVMSINKN